VGEKTSTTADEYMIHEAYYHVQCLMQVSPRSWDRTPSLGRPGLVNIPDAWLAENSPAMTSATLPSGYTRPPLHRCLPTRTWKT
jgi:hypothetical protein